MSLKILPHSDCGENTKMNCIFSLEMADFGRITESTSPQCLSPYLCGWLSLTNTESRATKLPERAFPVRSCVSGSPGVGGTTLGVWTVPSICSPPTAFGETQGGPGWQSECSCPSHSLSDLPHASKVVSGAERCSLSFLPRCWCLYQGSQPFGYQ